MGCFISDEVICSFEGVGAILFTLYENDPLAIVSSLFSSFSGLLATRRVTNETFKNFELQFCASVSKYSSYFTSVAVPDCILALFLLHNSVVSESQRIPILSAVASFATSTLSDADIKTNKKSNDLVTYEGVASVVRQLDQRSSDSSCVDDVNQAILV